MLRSILVGLDGSSHSTAAMELGIQWAKHLEALLIGLGIVDKPSICRPEPVPIGGGAYKQQRDEKLLEDARHRIAQSLDEFARRCEEARVAYRLLEEVGSPCGQILQESPRCDLILLAHQTCFRFGPDERPDQTLRMLLRSTPRPVVSVPEHLGDGSGVVVAYDGRREADRALQAFRTSGLDFGEEVHVLSMAADRSWASRCADFAAEFLQSHGLKAVGHPIASGQPVAQMILEHAQNYDARLIVMGAYGRSSLHEIFLGSVTDTVLSDSEWPVFLCH
jgi:nucleotide-binding universal stress UspA family protein